MNWFYAENGQRNGPISDGELISLAERGVVRATTLIWREGMPNWEALSTVRPDLVQSSGAAMLGGVAVPTHDKDRLVQQMREGVVSGAQGLAGMRYVGFWWRVLSYIIDFILLMVLQMMVMLVMGAFGLAKPPPPPPTGPINAGEVMFSGVDWLLQLVLLALQAFYYTWSTVKFGGTPGKLALGMRVVTPDGMGLRWGRSFGRWAANSLLNGFIFGMLFVFPVVLVLILGVGGLQNLNNLENSQLAGIWLLAMMGAMVLGGAAGTFPWWMAGIDSQKRALHDRVCGTRVVWR